MNEILKAVAGIVIGAIAGYLYQRVVGCSSGGCPITSNPKITMIYGALMGLMISLGR